jgi:pimeloyl-ACP methyl ester carboxylesterase
MLRLLANALLVLAALYYFRAPTVVLLPSDSACAARVLVSEHNELFGGHLCTIAIVQHHGLSFTVRDCNRNATHERPVLLLHGFPDDHATWERQIHFLVSANRRVLVPLLRGYEPSSIPRSTWYDLRSLFDDASVESADSYRVGQGYHVSALAADVVCLLDALHIAKADVIGHDWGAVIGHFVGSVYSERIGKLVSIAVPPQLGSDLDGVLRVAPSQLRNSWYFVVFQLPLLPEVLLRNVPAMLNKFLTDWSPEYQWAARREAIAATLNQPGVVVCCIPKC